MFIYLNTYGSKYYEKFGKKITVLCVLETGMVPILLDEADTILDMLKLLIPEPNKIFKCSVVIEKEEVDENFIPEDGIAIYVEYTCISFFVCETDRFLKTSYGYGVIIKEKKLCSEIKDGIEVKKFLLNGEKFYLPVSGDVIDFYPVSEKEIKIVYPQKFEILNIQTKELVSEFPLFEEIIDPPIKVPCLKYKVNKTEIVYYRKNDIIKVLI